MFYMGESILKLEEKELQEQEKKFKVASQIEWIGAYFDSSSSRFRVSKYRLLMTSGRLWKYY